MVSCIIPFDKSLMFKVTTTTFWIFYKSINIYLPQDSQKLSVESYHQNFSIFPVKFVKYSTRKSSYYCTKKTVLSIFINQTNCYLIHPCLVHTESRFCDETFHSAFSLEHPKPKFTYNFKNSSSHFI